LTTFNFNVDTTEMAETVSAVSTHVDGTTAAVVAMEAALIAVEKEAASEICGNVNRGFHRLILSQLSQRCAKAKSIVDAKLMELSSQSAALARIKRQMEGDYHRITSRYVSLFGSLNDALRARVFELDKPAADLADKEMRTAERRSLARAGEAAVLQLEVEPATQLLAIGGVRHDAATTLSRMRQIVVRSNVMKRATKAVARDAKVNQRQAISTPVAVVESDDLRVKRRSRSIVQPEGLGEGPRSLVRARLNEIDVDLPWQSAPDELRKDVNARCMKRASESALSERERATLSVLLEQSQWLTLGGARA